MTIAMTDEVRRFSAEISLAASAAREILLPIDAS